MRNHALKRIFAMVLVLAMILSTLPAISLGVSAAGFDANASAEIPLNTACVMYNASGAAVFGYDITDGVAASKSATVSEEGVLSAPRGAAAIVIVKNGDSYYLTIGGKYLTIDSAEDLSLSDTPQSGSALSSRWVLTADSVNGGYTVASKDVTYNGKAVYLECYNGFCGYTYNSSKSNIFAFSFFTLGKNADPDGDGYVGERPVANDYLPVDGDTVVIYNDYGRAVIGPMNAETGSSMAAISATVKNGVIDVEDGGLIFTVHKDAEGYYTFENGGKYLANPENKVNDEGKTINDENLFLQDTQSDYTKWTLKEMTGGYGIYNKAALYYSSQVCIEYFGEAFSGWTYKAANSDYFTFNFYQVADTDDHIVSKPSVAISELKAAIGRDLEVTVTVNDHKDLSNASATYTFDGAASGKTVTPTETSTAKVYTFTIPAAELEGHKNIKVAVTTTNISGGKGTATVTEAIADEPLILSCTPESATGTGTNKKPTITVKFANVGEGATFDMLVNNNVVKPTVSGDTATYTFPTEQADGKVVVSFTIVRKDGKSVNREWSFYIGEVGLGLYFGQFHSHTSEYSDGAETLEQAYEHAMNAKDVDFLIVTDHSNYFDTTSTATMDSIYDDAAESLTKSTTKDENGNLLNKWQEAKATAALYNTDSFVAAYGYEMTWSGGPGHTNTFNTKGIASRNNATLNNKTNYAGMLAYYDLTVDANAKNATWTGEGQISGMFNHPGVTFGTFGDFTGYTPARDNIMNLIEVGNGEGAVGGSSYWPSYEHYDNALAMGWHIAPANNQDNHKGNQGDANTCRDVVITDNFSEQGIYDAMAARHIYATEDQNLNILYYLKADANGDGVVSEDESYLQGDIISVDSDITIDKVTFNVSLRDPDGEALGKIEVIGEGGKTLWSKEVLASSYEMNETLDNTDAYYYIKVTEADDQIAVTAPVWVGETLPILFTSISTDSALSVVGEEETVTANFSNSSDYDFVVSKLYYTLDGKSEPYFTDTAAAGTTVAAGETAKTYTLKYVPQSSGKHVIEAVMEGTVPGMDNKKVTVSIKLTVKSYAAESLINVGVDYGHTNYYVSGDYAGNTNNFVAFCADNGARCYFIQAGEFTYENLKQYKLLFLTVPYRRNTAAATMYTAEEIAALKQYTDNGGNVVICSKSDRDNKYDNCANNTNALLEAIGAHSRMVNGIIVDNEMKANEAYRLYFSSIDNFNTEHRFTKGAYTSSNAFETVPAGDNQTGFQVYNGGPVEIMDGYEDQVEVLVKGYDTTWGSHYDGYFTGSAFVPEYDGTEEHVTVNQGDVNVMTYEDLPGGGWVVTSGVTFFSNYDIKDDQNYANKYILRNIIDDLTGASDPGIVTPIETVKKTPTSEAEKQYTIEGYITANASGYNKNTAFFDCIYVQEENGAGINVFPVAGYYKVGMHVRIHGAVTWYCGEIELNTSDLYDGYVKIISDELVELEPEDVTCKEAMADENIGQLMRVTGTVKQVHKTSGVVDKIYVTDNSGVEACVFINGYILNSKDDYSAEFLNEDGKVTEVAPGMKITAVGIGSRDVDETSANNEIFARLRVRDRAEITVSGAADYASQFDDIKPSDWFYKDVQFVSELGLMAGMTTRTFGPNVKLSRAMVVSILYRLDGRPALTSIRNPFTDVPKGQYYYEPVLWGAANGIVAGITEDTFAPNQNVTREQMVAFIYRYARFKGYDLSASASIDSFSDANKVSTYAVKNMQWAVAENLISGMNDGTLQPKGTATRAQFASIIRRFIQKFAPEAACKTHDFVETARVEATCTEDGKVTYTCSKCGAVTEEVLPALGHDYVDVVTKEATCTEAGVRTYTCSRCGDSYTEAIPATGHNFVDGVCTNCGEKDPNYVVSNPQTYVLTSAPEVGDQVIIYNAGNKMALNSALSGYYMSGTELTAENNKITTDETAVVWTVGKDTDGNYTFTQDNLMLGILQDGTFFNLKNAATEGVATGWTLETCNAENNSYYLYSATLEGTYGHVYAEWYAKQTAFSAYCTSPDRLTEAAFGFQFYKLDDSTDPDPDPEPEPEPEPKPATYKLNAGVEVGDQVIVYNKENKMALTSTLSGYYMAGAELTAENDVITTDDETVVWTVGKDTDGNYTFTQGNLTLGILQDGTFFNLKNAAAEGVATGWTLETCNAENNSYYLYSATLEGTYGHVYAEWYAKQTAFSAYCTSPDRLTEAAFGFQFYKLDETATPDPEPTPDPDPEPTPDPDPDPVPGNLVETALKDIKPTDKVLIVMHGAVTDKDYVMLNNGGTQTYGPAAVFDGKTYDDTMLWNVVATEGGYTLYVNGTTENWLYTTAANNGLRVGNTADGSVWSLDETSGYLKATDPAGTVRYLGVYDNNGGSPIDRPNFRVYNNTTGNTKNQTLTFYVVG